MYPIFKQFIIKLACKAPYGVLGFWGFGLDFVLDFGLDFVLDFGLDVGWELIGVC